MSICNKHGDRPGRRCGLCKADAARRRKEAREAKKAEARGGAVREALDKLPETPKDLQW